MKIQLERKEVVIFESDLFRTTTTLIIGEDYLLLVDPNWLPREIEFIYTYIKNLKSTENKYLLFTHSDYDHIIGYGRFKDYTTIASQNFVELKDQNASINQINTFDDAYYIERNYEIEYPRIDLSIKNDQERLNIQTDQYEFYQAEGHNPDGLFALNKTKGILIVGDYLINIEFPYIYQSVAKYKCTLDKLETIIIKNEVKYLITGHGDSTQDKKEILFRIEESRNYISQLEKAIKENKSFKFESLPKKYKFSTIMTAFHQGNITLMKKEWGMSTNQQ